MGPAHRPYLSPIVSNNGSGHGGQAHKLESSPHGTVKPRGRVALRGVDYYAPYWWSVLPVIATGIVAWQLPLECQAKGQRFSKSTQTDAARFQLFGQPTRF